MTEFLTDPDFWLCVLWAVGGGVLAYAVLRPLIRLMDAAAAWCDAQAGVGYARERYYQRLAARTEARPNRQPEPVVGLTQAGE